MPEQRDNYDSPWKEAIEKYFVQFMEFFFPEAYNEIDWSKGYEFLDKELQEVVRDAELGKRLVDKLVRVCAKNGRIAWVMIHVEVQGRKEQNFEKRMYVYNYRLFDRYDTRVASLAVLGDENPKWRPDSFGYKLWGCEVSIKFPIVKLMEYEDNIDELAKSRNPFAIIVAAHLKAKATKKDFESRYQWKLTLTKRLYEKGYEKEDILELYRFIDWIMALPKDLETQFTKNIVQFEEDKKMPYVSSAERLGREWGILEKAQEYVVEVLKIRFKKLPKNIANSISSIDDISLLNKLLKKAVETASLEDFQKSLANSLS